MQGQKNSRKHAKKITTHDQATRKHNERSSNTHACTTHSTYTKMQNAKTKTNMHNRKQKQISRIPTIKKIKFKQRHSLTQQSTAHSQHTTNARALKTSCITTSERPILVPQRGWTRGLKPSSPRGKFYHALIGRHL